MSAAVRRGRSPLRLRSHRDRATCQPRLCSGRQQCQRYRPCRGVSGDAGIDTTYATLGMRGAAALSDQWSVRGRLGWRSAFDEAVPLATRTFNYSSPEFSLAGSPIARSKFMSFDRDLMPLGADGAVLDGADSLGACCRADAKLPCSDIVRFSYAAASRRLRCGSAGRFRVAAAGRWRNRYRRRAG